MSLGNRLGKEIVSETHNTIDGYNQALDALMQHCRDSKAGDVPPINTYHILRDLADVSLEGMVHVKETTLATRKSCMEGTRTEVLNGIVNWINDTDVSAPRIFLLHGLAGQGKSTVIHTVAQWLEDVGKLSSYFCFAGDRQIDHREEMMFTTIARDLADHDPSFRQALANTVTRHPLLKTTRDATQQWERLLLEPMSKVSGRTVRNAVIIIDGLDQSGPSSSRIQILSALASKEAASLPLNIRILLASCPSSDILHALDSSPHIKVMSLDDIPTETTENELHEYISTQIDKYSGIKPHEIVKISGGLYEVARLACYYLKPHVPGVSARERLNDMMKVYVSGERNTLLDGIYRAAMGAVIGHRPIALVRFRSVMRQVIHTFEPLSMEAFTKMRLHFSDEDEQYDSNIIISFMGIVLTGVEERTTAVRPLQASLYTFLADESRSQTYFSGEQYVHTDLALASFCILRDDLRFNICGLESSYLPNLEVMDLSNRVASNIPLHLAYTCKYWIKHLMAAEFSPSFATMVRDVLGSEKVLFWLEVLSFLNGFENAAIDLASLGRWLQVSYCSYFLKLFANRLMNREWMDVRTLWHWQMTVSNSFKILLIQSH